MFIFQIKSGQAQQKGSANIESTLDFSEKSYVLADDLMARQVKERM